MLSRRRACCCDTDQPPNFGPCEDFWLRCLTVGTLIKVRAKCTKTIYQLYRCDNNQSSSYIPLRTVIEFDMSGEVKFDDVSSINSVSGPCLIYGSSYVVASMIKQEATVIDGTPDGCLIWADCTRETATVQGPGSSAAIYGSIFTQLPHRATFTMRAECNNPPEPGLTGSWMRQFVGACSGAPPQVIPGCFAGNALSAFFQINSKENECELDPELASGSVQFADGFVVPLEFQDYQTQVFDTYINNTGSVTVTFE